MRLVIHRGSNEIGGTCIELSAGGTTIWLDVGLPLKEAENAVLPVGRPDAVLISHPHQDHFGMLDKLEPHIPVYIGKVAVHLMNAARICQ